jgi:two-component system OmpR family response regulator
MQDLGIHPPPPSIAPALLLVEDDRVFARSLKQGLEEDGYQVSLADSFAAGFRTAMSGGLQSIVIDVMLPDGNGIDLARSLRAQGVDTPILMLTALGEADAVVAGLDSGADDYVVKPVSLDVLGARLRALHRRWHRPTTAPIRVGDLMLEPSTLLARRGRAEIDLTPAQAKILETLMVNSGNVLSRSQIARGLRDDGYEPGSNVIDVHIRALRSKIDEPFSSDSIETVRGFGYRLRAS